MFEICRFCGAIFVKKSGHQFFCSSEHRKAYKMRKLEEARSQKTQDQNFYQQLCWKCNKCYGQCSWSNLTFIPIEGWNAIESIKVDSEGNTYKAYTIIECPEFDLDRRFK